MASSHPGGDTEVTRVEPTGPVSSIRGAAELDPPTHPRGNEPRRGTEVGRYLVIDTLGRGGMGEVLSAYDPELDRRVALKLVRFGANEDAAKARERLLREAQAMAKLAHPNVVAVYDAGTHGDRVFIAMEHIEGRTLRQWLEERDGGADEEDPVRGVDPTGRAPSHPPTSSDDARPGPAGDWREALGLLQQAGRGLAAAHAVGLVHRDFKPANVMVSDDGRVRVLDFGLARRFGDHDSEEDPPLLSVHASRSGAFEPLDGPSRSRSSLRLQLTQTGMVMGTPAYMAPEQFFGGRIDARTDQFAFCVVLFRALVGRRPFAGDDFESLGRAVGRGELREIPKGSGLPRQLQAVLRRGLSVRRDDRYPTMDALLAELERAAGGGRRRTIVLGTGAAALLGVGALAWGASRPPEAGPPAPPPPCQGAAEIIEPAWGSMPRERMATAFAATEVAYAEDARVQIERALDDYADRWVSLHTETCEATRVRGDQSEALMDLRIGCLQGRLRDLGALTQLLSQADAEVVQNAVQGVLRLPRPEDCASLERDASGLMTPEDPARVEQVSRARERIAAARAQLLAGKYDDGEATATDAVERAHATDYAPAIAEAELVRAQIHERLLEIDDAREAYLQSLYAAVASGHGYVEAQALIGLLSMFGAHSSDTETALRYAHHARAVLERLHRPPELEASVSMYTGNTLSRANRYEEALEEFRHAIERSRDVPIAEQTHIGALNNLAAVLGNQGRYLEAAEAFESARAVAEARLGPRHPSMAHYYNNLGVTYARLEDFARAMQYQRRALAVWENTLGPDHAEIGRGYHNLGVVQSEMGDNEAAYESYRRALEIKRASLGPDVVTVAVSANNVGDTLLDLGRPLEAIEHLQEALRIWKVALGPEHPKNVYSLVSLARAHLALRQPDQARLLIEQALALIEKGELDPLEIARARFVAARVVLADGGDRAEARRLAELAKAGYEASDRPSPTEIAEIEAWLAARP